MRDKHEFWTEVRVKENCLSFVIALSSSNSQVKIEVSLRLSIFLPTVLPVVIQKQKLNAEWKKKGTLRWVCTAVFLVILITLHNFSCSFWFKLQCMHECMPNLIARRDYTVLKYSVCNNDRRPVKVFQSVFFTGLLIFRFASMVKEYTT